MNKPKILVVGSFVMDLIVSSERFPSSGETVIGLDYRTAPGGKGANQAVQAARLGAAVTMVGKVGDDAFGRELLASMRDAGVDVSHVAVTRSAPSAVGNVQLEVRGGTTANRIVVVPGANMAITSQDVAFLKEEIGRFDMVILQLEIPLDINRIVTEYANAAGVSVMLNTAPYAPLPPDLLTRMTYISPNEHEAAAMVGFPVNSDATVKEAVDMLRGEGIPNVIITLGDRGAALGNSEEFFISPCISGCKVQDPTAAGDSFVAAFCTGVCYGLAYEQAMRFANYTAGITVSRMGAQPSLPQLDEVLEQMGNAAGKDRSIARHIQRRASKAYGNS